MNKIPKMISLSKLNRGYAGAVLEEVNNTDEPLVIVKNNEPIAVVISLSAYNSMAVNSYRSPIDFISRKHAAAGSLRKYGRKELIGKEKELYHQALDEKYGK